MESFCHILLDNVTGLRVYRSARTFGPGTGPILLTDLGCSGSEPSLLACRKNVFHVTSCTHSSDVGLKCEGTAIQGTVSCTYCMLDLHIFFIMQSWKRIYVGGLYTELFVATITNLFPTFAVLLSLVMLFYYLNRYIVSVLHFSSVV